MYVISLSLGLFEHQKRLTTQNRQAATAVGVRYNIARMTFASIDVLFIGCDLLYRPNVGEH